MMNIIHLIAKIYKCLQEKNKLKCMIKWAKYFDYNIQMDQQETIWLKGLKFTFYYNLKENVKCYLGT